MKHLLKMSDLSPAELHHILDVAEELKAEQKAGTTPALLKGRSWRCSPAPRPRPC